jgi:glycosyltransferase involved in cell wall biosynthesis
MHDSIVMLPLDSWDDTWHSSHYIAKEFAARLPVLHVNPRPAWHPRARHFHPVRSALAHLRQGLSSVGRNLYVLTPRSLPLGRFNTVGRFDRSLFIHDVLSALEQIGSHSPLYWTHFYDGCLENLNLLSASHVVYDCPDLYVNKETERELTRRASLVIVRNKKLREQKLPDNPRTYWIPNGCDFKGFQLPPAAELPADLASIPRPRVGLVAWMDNSIEYNWLLTLAQGCPRINVILVGSVLRGRQFGVNAEDAERIWLLKQNSNVFWLGHKPPTELGRYVSMLDVGVIPYKDTPANRMRDPLKLYLYLAAGLPVVSSPLTSLEESPPGVYIVNDSAQFVSAIEKALLESTNEGAAAERVQVARSADWSERFKAIEAALIEVFGEWRSDLITEKASG